MAMRTALIALAKAMALRSIRNSLQSADRIAVNPLCSMPISAAFSTWYLHHGTQSADRHEPSLTSLGIRLRHRGGIAFEQITDRSAVSEGDHAFSPA